MRLDAATTVPSGDATTDWWSIVVQVITTLGALVTIIGLLFGAFMWFVTPRARRWVEDIASKVDSAERNTQQLNQNAGTHLADSVYRMERDLHEVKTTLTSVNELSQANTRRLDGHDRTFTITSYVLRQHGIDLPDIRNDT